MPAETQGTLELQNLRAVAGEVLLFDGLTAMIGGGEVLAVMGPSGAGKSTLLSLIAGFEEAGITWSGTVRLNGLDLRTQPPHRRQVGLVQQTPLLFPHLSVGQNLGFGLPRTVTGAARVQAITDALDSAGLKGFETRDPQSLSGGQRARVSLLRTLLSAPRALLLDEPFAALDETLRADMRAFTGAQIARAGLPTLLVTHDPEDAEVLGAKTLHLTQRST